MNVKQLITIIFFLSFLLINLRTKASHATAVDLKYEHISGETYEITVTFYRDCAGAPAPSNESIDISSSCSNNLSVPLTRSSVVEEVSPICPALAQSSTCNGGTFPGIEKYTYTAQYTFPVQCSDWKISFTHSARNNMITNLSGGAIYAEAFLNNTNGYNDNSPVLTTVPVIYACNNQLYNFNHGGYDPDGDSLVFSLVNALTSGGNPLSYVFPSTATYPVVDVRGYNEFDTKTGSINFNPNGTQVDVMTVKVEEYRNGILIGSTMRDMQLIVINCTNQQPSSTTGMMNQSGGALIDSNSIQTCPGETISFDISFSDPDIGDSLIVFSNLATVIPGASFTYSGSNPLTISFNWTPTGNNSGFHPFTFTIKDNSCPINVSQVYGYDIRVLPSTYAGEDDTYCPGGIQPILNATGGTVFNWLALSGDSIVLGSNFSCNPCANPIPTPAITTIYEVTSNLQSTCKSKDTVIIRNETDFTYSITPIDTFICTSSDSIKISTHITTTGTYSYIWTPNENITSDTISSPIVSPTETEIYKVIIQNDSTGCRMLDSVLIKVIQSIGTFTVEDDTYCPEGIQPILNTTGGTIFNWQALSGDSIIIGTNFSCNPCANPIPTPTITTTYEVTSDLPSICKNKDTVIIRNEPDFTYSITPIDTLICSSSNTIQLSAQITTGGTYSYIWTPNNDITNNTVSSPTVSPRKNETYQVIIRNDSTGCRMLDSIPITVIQSIDSVTIVGDTNLCTGDTISLEVTAFNNLLNDSISITNTSILWSNGQYLSDSTIVNPFAFPDTLDHIFQVTIIDSTCFNTTFSDSIKLNVIEYPNSFVSSSDSIICAGDTVSLSIISDADRYFWSIGSPDSTIHVAPLFTTSYFIYSFNNSCLKIDTTPSIVVNPRPYVSILGLNTLCRNDSITLIGNGIGDYEWNTGETTNDITVSPDSNTFFSLKITNQYNCSDSASESIIVHQLPFVNILGDSAICANKSTIILNAVSTGQHRWGNGEISPSITVTLNTDSIFTLNTTDFNNCSAIDTHIVRLLSVPNIYITGDSLIYYGEETILSGNGGEYYWWNTDETSDEIEPTLFEDIIYYVSGIDSNGCEGTDSIIITVKNNIIIPNIITPNGDGVNELFKILGLREGSNLQIYNRWGKLVYESLGYKNNWDGNELNDGTYYYNLTNQEGGELNTYKGWVEISR